MGRDCWRRRCGSRWSRELSRFQAVERDFSFVFSDAVTWAAIDAALHGAGAGLKAEELRSVRPVEIFRDAKGKAVAAGSYSLLLRVVFQSKERTLTEEEITRWTEWVVAELTGLGGVQTGVTRSESARSGRGRLEWVWRWGASAKHSAW